MKIRIGRVGDERPVEIELTRIDQLERRVGDNWLAERRGLEHRALGTDFSALRIRRAESAAPHHFVAVDQRQRESRDHCAIHQRGEAQPQGPTRVRETGRRQWELKTTGWERWAERLGAASGLEARRRLEAPRRVQELRRGDVRQDDQRRHTNQRQFRSRTKVNAKPHRQFRSRPKVNAKLHRQFLSRPKVNAKLHRQFRSRTKVNAKLHRELK